VRQARAGFWPTVAASLSASHGQSPPTEAVGTSYSTGATANWDLDLWGSIRRSVENQRSSAQAQLATLANARLSAQADVATDYFALRAQDQLQKLLDDTVEAENAVLEDHRKPL